MGTWIVAAAGKRREKVYRLPARCAQCKSRDVMADIHETYGFMPGPWVVQKCYVCDDTRATRLIRDESDSPSPVWMS